MRCKVSLLLLIPLAFAIVLASGCSDEEVPIDKLPQPVVKAVNDKYPDAKLIEAEKENENGKTIYEVKIKRGDKTLEVKVSADGKLLADDDKEEKNEKKEKNEDGEEKIALDKLPKGALDAVKRRFPNAEVKGASKESENGKSIYEVTVKQDGKTIDVTLSPDAVITLIEKEIDAKDAPKAVADAVAAKYKKAEWKVIEEVSVVKDGKETVDFYEYHGTVGDKKTVEVKVSPDGTIKEEEVKKEKKEGDKKKGDKGDVNFTSDFSSDKAELVPTGRNPYFILEPGHQLVLEDDDERLVVTVLNETKVVDGVTTRIVEERETKKGKLVEVSRNYFAISKRTNNVYYFGEEVDIYKNDKIVSHEGAWLSGEKKASFGLMMPGLPLLKARFYQEVAPGQAMDRAEIVSLSETVKTPAGTFKDCLKVAETTPLEPGNREFKYYAPGIGLIQDGSLKLVKHGKADGAK